MTIFHTAQHSVNSCGRLLDHRRTSGGRERKNALLVFIPLTQCSTPRPAVDQTFSHTSRPRMAMRATASGVTRTAHGERAAVATLDRAAACACRHSTRRSSVRCHERSSRHRAGAPHVHLVRADATHRAPRSRHSVGQRCGPTSATVLRPTPRAPHRHGVQQTPSSRVVERAVRHVHTRCLP